MSPVRTSPIPSAGRSSSPMSTTAVSTSTPTGDPVFAAFCAAGLWPGLGRRTAADLPAAGTPSPDDVSADRLLALPRVGRQRAERLFSSFLSAQPTYEVVELLVGAGLNARLAAGVADALGPDAARRLRDDPWALLGLSGVTLADADRLAITVLAAAARQATPRARGAPPRPRRGGRAPRAGDRRAPPAPRPPRRAPRAAGRPGGRGTARRADQRPG